MSCFILLSKGHKASNRTIGEKVCMHKYSAYCVSDFENDVQEVSSKVNPENENESNAKVFSSVSVQLHGNKLNIFLRTFLF